MQRSARFAFAATIGFGVAVAVTVFVLSRPDDVGGSAAADGAQPHAPQAAPAQLQEVDPTETCPVVTQFCTLPYPQEDPAPSWFERYDPAHGIEENGSYGWGSTQPDNMRPIHLGSSNEQISPERRALLGSQLQRARDAALEIGTVGGAKAAGYVRVSRETSLGRIEYVNYDYGDLLDIDHPSMMVFADDSTDDQPVIAVAYGVLGTYEDGPPTEFPLEMIPWHFHGPLCEDESGFLIADKDTFDVDPSTFIDGNPADCVAHGGTLRTDLAAWMVDMWVVPGWENPWGLISSKHPDLIPQPWAEK